LDPWPGLVSLIRLAEGPSEANFIAQLIDLFVAHQPAVPGGKGSEAGYSRG
jgi:hypothetical protein